MREALVNLFIHQDYADKKAAAQVDIAPGVVTFFNPGFSLVGRDELPVGVKSQSRNPLIARALRLIGFAELAASGLRNLNASGRPPIGSRHNSLPTKRRTALRWSLTGATQKSTSSLEFLTRTNSFKNEPNGKDAVQDSGRFGLSPMSKKRTKGPSTRPLFRDPSGQQHMFEKSLQEELEQEAARVSSVSAIAFLRTRHAGSIFSASLPRS